MMVWRLLTVAAVSLALSCGLGGEGDDCVTPQDCGEGLQCYGGTCTNASLTCGEGTADQNGVCRYTPRTCGTGTVETDAGVCVPEEEGQ